MSPERAKELGYTNYGTLYGFEGYVNLSLDAETTFKAKYIISDWIVELMIHIEVWLNINGGFPIYLGEEL